MKRKIKKIIWGIRFKRACRKADKMARTFNDTYFVLLVKGRLKVCSRKALKGLIRERRFSKGVNIRTFERIALYTA